MEYLYPFVILFKTRPKQLRSKGIVALAPLVMLVWLAYWVGMVSQACCQPPLSVAHHSSDSGDHGDHHVGDLAAHEHDTPIDHESCPELVSDDLVPSSTIVLSDSTSTSQPVLIASLSLVAPEPIFSTSSSHTLSQQSHPPPSRFLRTRRLLI